MIKKTMRISKKHLSVQLKGAFLFEFEGKLAEAGTLPEFPNEGKTTAEQILDQ